MRAWTGLAVVFCSAALCRAGAAQVERVHRDRRAEAEQRALDRISAVVRGQCVDGDSGEPKAGCVVELRTWGGGRGVDAPESLLRPAAVTTGADGRFAVRVAAHDDLQVGLEITADGCWPRTGRWRHLVPGEVDDLGRIAMHRGVHARGRVVDTAGRPVPRVTVGIDELPLYLGAERDRGDTRPLAERLRAHAESGARAFHLHANKVRYGGTGADGAFTTEDALPPGTHELRVSSPGMVLVEPKTITVPAVGPMEPITIVVERPPFLAGRVVDESGEPVAGVSLRAETGSGRVASGHSGADGRFEIYRVEGAPERVRLVVDDPGPCERPAPSPEHAWGTHDIEIALQRAQSVDVLVVEAGTGEPVEDFAVRGYPTSWHDGIHSLDRRLRLAGHHEGGKLTVDRVRRGQNRITILPKDPCLLPASIDVEGRAGQPPVEVEVQRLVGKMVRVLDAAGLPAPGVEVMVIEPGSFQRTRGRDVIVDPRADVLAAFSSSPDVTFDTVLYSARTDGGGTCIVHGIDGREDLELAVRVEGRPRLQRVTGVAFGRGHGSQEIRLDE